MVIACSADAVLFSCIQDNIYRLDWTIDKSLNVDDQSSVAAVVVFFRKLPLLCPLTALYCDGFIEYTYYGDDSI